MNKFFLFFAIITVSLQARLDPFEPIKKNNKPIQNIKPTYSPYDKGRTVKIIPQIEKKSIKIKKDINLKLDKKDKKILKNECKIILDREIKKIKKEALKKEKIIKKRKKKKIIKVVKYKEFIPTTYKVLPFITIDIGKKYISAISRPKYKILRYYFLKDEKKVVFDFRAKVNMRTRYKLIENHPYFKAYKIGNHPDLKDYFFRVVIELKKAINQFKVIINQNKATLIYRK